MGTRCSRLLRKERVVVLGKLDCWIEQARSRLCHAGGRAASRNGCSGQDSNATGCDITILVATVRVVSRTGSLASAHTVTWDSSIAAGLVANISDYSSTSRHSQFIGRHLIHTKCREIVWRASIRISGRELERPDYREMASDEMLHRVSNSITPIGVLV